MLTPIQAASILRDNSIPTDDLHRQVRARALAWVCRYYLETLIALEILGDDEWPTLSYAYFQAYVGEQR
jgi:hypothetical protein